MQFIKTHGRSGVANTCTSKEVLVYCITHDTPDFFLRGNYNFVEIFIRLLKFISEDYQSLSRSLGLV